LVVGIGINVAPPGPNISEVIRAQMACLTEIAPVNFDRNFLVAQIALELEHILDNLSRDSIDEILNGWRQYAVTLGESVIATIGDQQIAGVAIDIDHSGALILETNAGRRALHAGEVTIRQANGSYV
jgi:BirA family transcriptional regulator, biotin operon repressor / biotin---[acetyl-CoA-carboxylase] ligase